LILGHTQMNETLNKINRVAKLVKEEIITNQKNQLMIWVELKKLKEKDSQLSAIRIQSKFVVALYNPNESDHITQKKVLDTINRLELDVIACHENQRLFWKRLTQLRKRETYLLIVKERASKLLSIASSSLPSSSSSSSSDGVVIVRSITV